jgi:hypothetical protein
MQRLCPEECHHWWLFPFRHLVVLAREPKGGIVTFIVCAHCRHDVSQPKNRCRCRAACHTEAREGRTYRPEWVAAQCPTG